MLCYLLLVEPKVKKMCKLCKTWPHSVNVYPVRCSGPNYNSLMVLILCSLFPRLLLFAVTNPHALLCPQQQQQLLMTLKCRKTFETLTPRAERRSFNDDTRDRRCFMLMLPVGDGRKPVALHFSCVHIYVPASLQQIRTIACGYEKGPIQNCGLGV